MMVVDLLDVASDGDNFFTKATVEEIEQANRIASLLTAFGVLPVKRQAQHSINHMLFAACILTVATKHLGSFKLGTRDASQLSHLTLGSGVLQWLQKAVDVGLLHYSGDNYQLSNALLRASKPLTDAEVINA
jgi:hypothetical protein